MTKTLANANHWLNIDPELQFIDPLPVDLLHYWEGKRRDRLMPMRRDIDPVKLKVHLGNLALIDVEYGPLRLRYRLIGTTITQTLGRDMTGRYLDEIYPPNILADAITAYMWTTENQKPLRFFGNVRYANKSMVEFEAVNLPLSEDGSRVNIWFRPNWFSGSTNRKGALSRIVSAGKTAAFHYIRRVPLLSYRFSCHIWKVAHA